MQPLVKQQPHHVARPCSGKHYSPPLKPLAFGVIALPSKKTLLAFSMLILLAGCSNDDSPEGHSVLDDLIISYPTLAREFGFDQADLTRLLNAQSYGNRISVDTVDQLVIGSAIRTDLSEYLNRPIFNINELNKASLLETNLNSSSTAKTSLALTSNKNATNFTEQWKHDYSGSMAYGGFQLQAAYHQENKYQGTSSDGSVNVTMDYSKTGAYISILPKGFQVPGDFSQYLLGTALTQAQIESYINYSESYSRGYKYISGIKILNEGVLPDNGNVYGNIQLIGEMERLFNLLTTQYDYWKGYADIQSTTLRLLRELRNKISNAIDRFKMDHGQYFVSRVNLMNFAFGRGSLKFGMESGNREAVYGAALSVKYTGLGGGVGVSGDLQYARRNGWAASFKESTVVATSKPASIKTSEWVSAISKMLADEQSAISVPAMDTLPTKATLTLPEVPDPKKIATLPPAGVFKSYQDWKDYFAKKKENINQDVEAARRASEEIEKKGVHEALQPNKKPEEGAYGSALDDSDDSSLYETLVEELDRLERRREALQHAREDDTDNLGNIMRVDDMFTSGFKTTAVEDAIPQLRPNLSVPGEAAKLPGYPNITRLMLAIDNLGRLDSYLRFLSNFAVSRVSATISQKYHSFYQEGKESFRDGAFALIRTARVNGIDISDNLLASFAANMFGQNSNDNKGALCAKLGDIDVCRYIKATLLAPENVKVWASAPGGYIPFGFDWYNKKTGFINLSSVLNVWGYDIEGYHPLLKYTVDPFENPGDNPLSFYGKQKSNVQSPWFPIFQFNQKQGANLLFLQIAGPYQLIYGRKYIIYPWDPKSAGWSEMPKFDSLKPFAQDAQITEQFVLRTTDPENSLSKSCGSFQPTWDYSLYFPKSSEDPARNQKFNVLTLSNGHPCNQTWDHSNAYDKWYGLISVMRDYRMFKQLDENTPPSAQVVVTKTGTVVNLYDLVKTDPWAKEVAFILLLPVNKVTAETLFDEAFSYTMNLGPSDIVPENSFDDFYKTAVNQ